MAVMILRNGLIKQWGFFVPPGARPTVVFPIIFSSNKSYGFSAIAGNGDAGHSSCQSLSCYNSKINLWTGIPSKQDETAAWIKWIAVGF